MSCPDEVADAVLEILRIAVLRIRAAGWAGNPDQCAVEADHIHNLPSLLTHFDLEALKYYWDVERPCYVERVETPAAFQQQWERLATFLQPAVTERS